GELRAGQLRVHAHRGLQLQPARRVVGRDRAHVQLFADLVGEALDRPALRVGAGPHDQLLQRLADLPHLARVPRRPAPPPPPPPCPPTRPRRGATGPPPGSRTGGRSLGPTAGGGSATSPRSGTARPGPAASSASSGPRRASGTRPACPDWPPAPGTGRGCDAR